MSRTTTFLPRWRKRLSHLPPRSSAKHSLPQFHFQFRPHPPRNPLLQAFSLSLLFFLFFLLAINHPQLPLLTPYPLSPHLNQDPRALEISRQAVTDLLSPPTDPLPPSLFSPENDSQNLALLVNIARIPPVFASRLSAKARSTLLRKLTANSNGLLIWSAMPRLLIVDLQNGLGNRLRALGSALEFAFYTRRILVIIWAPDPHINATMSHLFDHSLLQNLILIEHPVQWPIQPADIHHPTSPSYIPPLRSSQSFPKSFRYVSLMSKDNDFHPSRRRVKNIPSVHIYLKTAYLLDSKYNSHILVNPFIQALRPSPTVLNLVRHVQTNAGGPAALRAMVGVHIRSRSISADNEKVDHECEYSIDGAALTDRWRQMSTPAQFIPEMHSIRNNWPTVVRASYALTPLHKWSQPLAVDDENADFDTAVLPTPVDIRVPPRFYVAADSIETVHQLYSDFDRDDIVYLPRNCDDRGPACILYAFADIIVLSKTGAMLASGWSSFSEAATRLRIRPLGMDPSRNDGYLIRTSGIDFGTPSFTSTLRYRWRRFLRALRTAADEPLKNGTASQEERRRLCFERQERNQTKRTSVT